MENFDEHIDAYIARHLAGETTPAEEAILQVWMAKSPENRRYFADLQAIWEKSPAMRPAASRTVDTEAALEKVKIRLRSGGGTVRPLTIRTSLLWRAAAAVLLVVTAAYFLWLRNDPGTATIIAATDTALTDTLTDGSVIALSSQSGLMIAKNFNIRERRVRLHGEARFKVAPDTTRPFIVETADLEVRVVGTEFH
ncbi:MAG TPA: FecR domain-containing protein, partial [Saprospiraceae bacterium]|nr:FecR domain-containing protein [Saprospiraceae bacterium]